MDNNPTVINFFIDDIIEKCYVKSNFDFDINKLTIFDKLIILLMIKSYSVASDVKFNITCAETEKLFNTTVSVTELYILLLQCDMNTSYHYTDNNVKVHFSLPREFKEFNKEDIIYDCVTSIELKGKEIDIINADVIERLPASIIGGFKTFLDNENKKITSSPIITYKSPFSPSDKKTEVYISLFDSSIIETVKLFFETDLLDLYETEYLLIKEHNFSQDLFENKSAAEMFAYISIIDKFREKEEAVSTPGFVGAPLETGVDNLE
tara:strand:+ start:215 stop:1009 length:795 start_codon:yes stop_codon:yes gene_type:complete